MNADIMPLEIALVFLIELLFGLGAMFVRMAGSGSGQQSAVSDQPSAVSGQVAAVSDEATRPVLFKMCSDCLDLTPHYLFDGYCECVICGTRIFRDDGE